jgi:hypothetical protein
MVAECSGSSVLGTVSTTFMWSYDRVGTAYHVNFNSGGGWVCNSCGINVSSSTGSASQTTFEGFGEFAWVPTSIPATSYKLEGTFEMVGI